MGCDIHAIFQAKDGDKWKDIATGFDEPRHYRLYGVLAGVRNGDIGPISEPRGLPHDFQMDGEYHDIADASFDAPWTTNDGCDPHLQKWMGDHSHSWLLGSEMLNWFAAADIDEKDRENLQYFFDFVADLVAKHSEVRFVFGFDN